MTKFWKLKIWIDSFVAFSVGYVVKYIIFSVDAVFMEKFATQNRLFLDFSKNQKNVDFVRQITTPRMHPKNFWLFLSRSIFRWLHHGIQYEEQWGKQNCLISEFLPKIGPHPKTVLKCEKNQDTVTETDENRILPRHWHFQDIILLKEEGHSMSIFF